jgi:predicted CXXCH cytochrome family protein
MKNWLRRNHFWRPLLVVVLALVVVLVVRTIYIPGDFGIHGSFTYNFYRQANVGEWQSVSVKYQGREYCRTCHQHNYDLIMASPHSVIQCEDCHGPGIGHPETVKKLTPGNSRQLCWRCHIYLPYPGSGRSVVPGIEPNAPHAPLGMECYSCHNPHQPAPLPDSQVGED